MSNLKRRLIVLEGKRPKADRPTIGRSPVGTPQKEIAAELARRKEGRRLTLEEWIATFGAEVAGK